MLSPNPLRFLDTPLSSNPLESSKVLEANKHRSTFTLPWKSGCLGTDGNTQIQIH